MLPLNVNEIKGYWLDQPTFDFTGFKLSVAVGCEYQLVEERKYRTSIETDRDLEKLAKEKAQGDFKSLVKESDKFKQENALVIQGLNDKIQKNQTTVLKRTLRSFVIIGIIVPSVWALTKKGVL